MGDKTGIEWTDATWNPIVGCSIVSPGCTNCYAMKQAARIERMNVGRHGPHALREEDISPSGYDGLTKETKAGAVWTGDVRLARDETLTLPLRWKRPRKIFVNSMGDLFHESVPNAWIDRVFAVMGLAPQHQFQVLTKRSKRMREYCSQPAPAMRWWDAADALTIKERFWNVPSESRFLPNVWLGVSTEDQTRADERIPDLLATPAAVRFVSAEPLLGPIDFERLGSLNILRSALPALTDFHERDVRPNSISGMQIEALGSAGQAAVYYQTPDHMGGFSIRFPRPFPRLDWIIVGGESGSGARPMHPDWARGIRDQCKAAGVAYFHKQNGEWIDADEWLRMTETPSGRVMVGQRRLVSPLNYEDAEILAGITNDRFEPQSDGSTTIRVGKAHAGRLLDGRSHSEFPEALP